MTHVSERPSSLDDGHFLDRLRVFGEVRDESVAGLVVGCVQVLVFVRDTVFLGWSCIASFSS